MTRLHTIIIIMFMPSGVYGRPLANRGDYIQLLYTRHDKLKQRFEVKRRNVRGKLMEMAFDAVLPLTNSKVSKQ